MMQLIKTALAFLLLTTLLFTNGCELLPLRMSQTKNGEVYGITSGLFRHRWWHYYERALSFADGGFWKDSELDLRSAIQMRSEDQRRARTYGMHFTDYFPHRELGVALYYLWKEPGKPDKLIEKAIEELEKSYKMAKSAKAEFYLDRARKALIEKKKQELLPEITIRTPQEPFVTNDLTVLVKGIAKDEKNFVRHITVGGAAFRVDVSDKEMPFSMRVPVNTGKNTIKVTVENLAGKTAEAEVVVQVDRIGPIIGEDGYVFDDSGLTELTVDGEKFSLNTKEIRIQDILPSLPQGKNVEVTATDQAGNVTSANIIFSQQTEMTAISNLLAKYDSPDGILSDVPEMFGKTGFMLAQCEGATSVEIKLKYSESRVTYLDQAIIEGTVCSNERNLKLSIATNKEEQQVIHAKIPRSNYHFNYLAKLFPGQNHFDIKADSPTGKSDEMTVTIERKIPNFRKPKFRLQIAIHHFDRIVTDDVKVQFNIGFEKALVKKLSGFKVPDESQTSKFIRFKKVEELNNEGQNQMKDEDKIRAYAKEKGFHGVLFGRVDERKNSEGKHTLSINATLKDTEGNILAEAADTEVYSEDIDNDNNIDKQNALAEYMAIKLTDKLPMIEGEISQREDDWIVVDIGNEEKIKKGIDLIAYKPGRSIMGHTTEPEILGEAKVENVETKTSLAELRKEEGKVEPKHNVITR